MSEEYIPSPEEKKLMVRFTMDLSLHTWETKDKIGYIAYLNKRAGLPFGTIGILHTEYEDKKKGLKIVKDIPYASRQTTVELAAKKGVSLEQRSEYIDTQEARYVYRATTPDGRYVDAVGSCALVGYGGSPMPADQRSNKIMHAETKAKRRATLEICGLAFIDESEAESIEGATIVALPESPDGVIETPKTPAPGAATRKPAVSTPALATASAPEKAQPAPTPPAAVQAAAIPAPAPVLAFDGPARFKDHAALFAGEPNQIVADAAHMQFIVDGCKNQCGWDGATMTKWLVETFGLRMANKDQVLTLDVFKRIAAGIDSALTVAGR